MPAAYWDKVGPGQAIAVQVDGVGGVPSSGVTAVVMIVTMTEPTDGIYLTVYPSYSSLAPATNVNYTLSLHDALPILVKVGSDGKVNVYNCCGSTHVVIDVAGYFTGSSPT